eukprot:Polyplicarium_translucidae@DN2701_c0_g1_i5.p1
MKQNTGKSMTSTLTRSVFVGLRDWQDENRLKQAVLQLLARNLTEHQIHALRRKFATLDVQRDGTISIMELRQSMRRAGLDVDDAQLNSIMSSFNTDSRNRIGFNEFISALLARRYAFREEQLREVFEKFDIRSEGRITVSDLKIALKGTRDGQLTDAELEMIFESVDKNGDGFVDFYDFLELMNT